MIFRWKLESIFFMCLSYNNRMIALHNSYLQQCPLGSELQQREMVHKWLNLNVCSRAAVIHSHSNWGKWCLDQERNVLQNMNSWMEEHLCNTKGMSVKSYISQSWQQMYIYHHACRYAHAWFHSLQNNNYALFWRCLCHLKCNYFMEC